ncbi:hypothetical protein EVAR_55855_1 [Eumeta japonica]|uniref:Uncharacterized protein n=1 Tax=Eumeta variegata TaxID=151549 RepID=A0A4C1ZE74_EUMVA|nr:hypothetical protein EVAR_55855_1 [Eumeta japonica]
MPHYIGQTRVTRSTRADAGARDAVLHGLDGSQPPSGLRSFDGKSSGYRTNGYAVRCSRSRNAESALSGLSDLRFWTQAGEQTRATSKEFTNTSNGPEMNLEAVTYRVTFPRENHFRTSTGQVLL